MPVNHIVRKTQLFTYHAYLILIEQFDRLYKFKLQIIGQTADIMMGFYRTGLYNIGIYGTLCQEFYPFLFAGLLLKDADKFGTYYLALPLRVGYTGQFVKEPVGCIDVNQIGVKFISKQAHHLLRLTFAHKSVIDMDRYQLFAYSLDEKRRHNR